MQGIIGRYEPRGPHIIRVSPASYPISPTQMNWIEISAEWIPEQEGLRKVKISGRNICLIRHQDKLYASSVRCPHAGADLTGGWCERGRLICPYHRHAFNHCLSSKT